MLWKSAGRSLGAYATLHHYYIVSCGNWGECRAFDITGDELLCQKQPVNRITFDLDRRMVHLSDANAMLERPMRAPWTC